MSQRRRLIVGDSHKTTAGKVSVPVLPQFLLQIFAKPTKGMYFQTEGFAPTPTSKFRDKSAMTETRHVSGLPQVYSAPFAGRQGERHDVLSGSTTPYIVLRLLGIKFSYGGISFAILAFKCFIVITRCPQDVDVAKVMDAVKITALHQRIKPAVQRSFRLCLKKILYTWRCFSGLGVFHFVEQGTLAY
jgi:hypothetical protein